VELQSTVERRERSINKLNTLMETRTETLALLNQLIGMRPFDADEDIQNLLQEFCESLVDYTASAHFQLYRFIEEGRERRSEVRDLAEKIYPRIAGMTRDILDFNEKYDSEAPLDNLSMLDQDLSRLGEVLADRIMEEDKIINLLLEARK
jgi:regulator of sigma D